MTANQRLMYYTEFHTIFMLALPNGIFQNEGETYSMDANKSKVMEHKVSIH
jgi:hypothetical protein